MLPFKYLNLRMNTSNGFLNKNLNNANLIWKGIRQPVTLNPKAKFI